MTQKILNKAILEYGRQQQAIVAIEEMSELTKEITKALRGDPHYDAMTEELADVYIMLEQIKIMYQITDKEVIEKVNQKLTRLEKRMKGEHE